MGPLLGGRFVEIPLIELIFQVSEAVDMYGFILVISRD